LEKIRFESIREVFGDVLATIKLEFESLSKTGEAQNRRELNAKNAG
jgi:hypothetical protein